MTDVLWQLAEQCWSKLPAARPKSSAVCDILSNELRNINVDSMSKPIPHSISHASPVPDPSSANVDDKKIVETSGSWETIRPASIDVKKVRWTQRSFVLLTQNFCIRNFPMIVR
jgi:hypothetical protein